MKRVAIFGAGQAGAMVKTWLPGDTELLCFIDNYKEKQGLCMEGCPVLGPEEALRLQPEEILLAMLNREAAQAVRTQLRESGFRGPCVDLEAFRTIQDVRLSALRLQAREIEERNLPGDVAELGVYQGVFAAEINRLFPRRRLWLFDTFEGFHPRDLDMEAEQTGVRKPRKSFADTTVELVRARLPYPEQARFVKGYFPESLQQLEGDEGCFEAMRNLHKVEKNTDKAENSSKAQRPTGTHADLRFALVSLDPDLYAPTLAGLQYFYPRLVPGGRILIHDYTSCQFEGVKKAVDQYCRAQGLFVLPLMDLHGTAVLLKQGVADTSS
ncbi:MAG TPA: hypothetical protein DIW34_01410 [Oribacterium sp.]|nr:hypothetical protein [Oribacterium sp.]